MDRQMPKTLSSPKRNKYKSLLTSFLSPSSSKHAVKKKESAKIYSSPSIDDEGSCKKMSNFDTFHHSSDSLYAEVENFDEKMVSSYKKENLENVILKKKSQSIMDLKSNQSGLVSDETIAKEPIYTTVKKNLNVSKPQLINTEIKDLKENNKLLKERLKDLSADNRLLRKKMQDLMKEEKRREDVIHSKLQLRITELESETRKEVKSLSDHIKILVREKEVLNDQLDALQSETKQAHIMFEESQQKLRSMVSLDVHKKVQIENQKLISDLRKQLTDEIIKLKEQIDVLEESKTALENNIKELENTVRKSKTKLENLENDKQKLLEEKKFLLEQAEDSKQMEQDMQAMLLSLLKLTENIALERNVLINKTSYQDHQQKEIQTTVVDYSLNIGRLQEHILTLSKENNDELLKLQTNKFHQEESMQVLYGKQLDILREKILAQNDMIYSLKSDKKKLESQLELIWQAACGTNSKLVEDVKTLLQTHTI